MASPVLRSTIFVLLLVSQNAVLVVAQTVNGTTSKAGQSAPDSRSGGTSKEAHSASESVEIPHEGSISGNVYTNEFFGFSVEVPPGWKVGSNRGFKKLQDKAAQSVTRNNADLGKLQRSAEIDSPLLVMGEIEVWDHGPNHRLVQLLSTDVSTRPGVPSAQEYLKLTGSALTSKGQAREYISQPEPVTIGGRILWKAYFTQNSLMVWHGVQFVTIEKKHVLQFVLLSPGADGLQSLEVLLRTLHFDSGSKEQATP